MPSKNKELKSKYQKVWYEHNKKTHIQKVAVRRKRVIAENRNRMKDAGYICSHCGEDDIIVMEFHHENPESKDYDIGRLLSGGYSWGRIQEEIDKCVPLCANCHRREHWRLKMGR